MDAMFREDHISELENLPRINEVSLYESESNDMILEITPNTVSDSDIEDIKSILKSVVPNYVISTDPENLLVMVYYEKESNTYKLFATDSEEVEEDIEFKELDEESGFYYEKIDESKKLDE